MKMKLSGVPVVKSARPSKDGKINYYNVGIAQDDEMIEFSTTESVFKSLKLYSPANFELTLTKGVFDGKVFERKTITAILA